MKTELVSKIEQFKEKISSIESKLPSLSDKEKKNANKQLNKIRKDLTEAENALVLWEKNEKNASLVKPSKCARIDQLWLEKGVTKGRAEEILAIIKLEYPDCNEESTMRTIRCRPWHLRQKNLLPPTTRGKVVTVTTVAKETPVENPVS